MIKIRSIINRVNTLTESIKEKINSTVSFEDGFKVDKVFISSAIVNYELERLTFIVELKDEDETLMVIPTSIINTYGKITIDITSFDLFENDKEIGKYLDIFKSLNFTDLENIIIGYKSEQEILFDLLNSNAKFKESRRISKVICSPLFVSKDFYPKEDDIALSIKIVSMDKGEAYNNTLKILLDKDGIFKAGNDSYDSTYEKAFDDFENSDEIKDLLMQFFVTGLSDDVLTRKVPRGKEEMEYIDTFVPIHNESIFEKINKFLKKILDKLTK